MILLDGMILVEEKNNRINQLLPMLRVGDSQAITSVIALLEKDLQKLAMKFLVNTQDAEIAVNESLYKFFQKINRLKNEVNLYAWIKTVVVNTSFDIIKKYKKEVSYEGLIESYSNTFKATSNDATEQIFVRLCLAKLNKEERTVLVLHSQDYTLNEIAEITKLSLKRVRNRLRDAKENFANHYAKGKL